MSNNGKVGPFFYINGEVFGDSIENNKAETYGDFKTWGNHSNYWDTLSNKYLHLKYMEYFDCPRGRVTYNTITKKYYIYLNPKLNNASVLEKIVNEFDLNGLDYTVDDTDEHYQQQENC